MKNKIGFNPVFIVIAIPIIIALFRDLDTQNLRFREPALDTLYIVTFLVLLFLVFRKKKNPSEPTK